MKTCKEHRFLKSTLPLSASLKRSVLLLVAFITFSSTYSQTVEWTEFKSVANGTYRGLDIESIYANPGTGLESFIQFSNYDGHGSLGTREIARVGADYTQANSHPYAGDLVFQVNSDPDGNNWMSMMRLSYNGNIYAYNKFVMSGGADFSGTISGSPNFTGALTYSGRPTMTNGLLLDDWDSHLTILSGGNAEPDQIVLGHRTGKTGNEGWYHSIKTGHNGGSGFGNQISFYLWDQGVDSRTDIGTQQVMTLDSYAGGRVGIGTTTPTRTLDVNGDIGAVGDCYVYGTAYSQDIVVDADASSFPDYVFDKDYNLMPLEEVEQYITDNHHLPEVPSAEEVAESGINVGDMQETLLKKIEELTLHMIQMKKDYEKLKDDYNELKANQK